MGEARQACVIDTAEFAVEMGGPRLHIRKCRYRAWIFLAPVEPGPSQELRAAIVDARGQSRPTLSHAAQMGEEGPALPPLAQPMPGATRFVLSEGTVDVGTGPKLKARFPKPGVRGSSPLRDAN
jgi:hypothetical protein